MTITIDQIPNPGQAYRVKSTGELMTYRGTFWTQCAQQLAVFTWTNHLGHTETLKMDLIRACREMEVVK